LLPKHVGPKLHLRIGRTLLQKGPRERIDEMVFEVASHLNAARTAIQDVEARVELSTIDLRACRKAKAAGAYPSALEYAVTGADVLAPARASHAGLSFALDFERAECEFLNGNIEMAVGLLGPLLGCAPGPVEKMAVYQARQHAELAMGDIIGAVEDERAALDV